MTDAQPQPERRRPRFLLIAGVALLVLLLAAGAAALFIFQPGVPEAFEPDATLPPTAAAPADEGGALYETGFEEPEAATLWETFDDGFIAASIQDGRLVVAVEDFADVGTWSGLNLTFEDYVLEVDAQKVAGPDDNGIFVVFHLTDEENYNRFDISSDGFYALSRVRDGLPEDVSAFRFSDAIQQGEAVNTIRIESTGGSFRFFVNGEALPLCVNEDPEVFPLWEDALSPDSGCLGGEVVEVWQSPDIERGKIGLGAQGFVGFDGENTTPAEATIAFDNVTISPPEATP